MGLAVELPIFTLIGLLVMAIMFPITLVFWALEWRASNRRYDTMREQHVLERRGWEARDRDAWFHVDQLAREIAELRGVLNVRRARRRGE